MKYFQILVLIFISYTANCQTLRETQRWIKSKIENNGYTSNNAMNLYEVTFSDSVNIEKNTMTIVYYLKEGLCALNTYTIPIKNIYNVTYDIDSYGERLWLKINLNPRLPSKGILRENYDCDSKVCKFTEYVAIVQLKMGKGFINDNLPNRFVKAMNHLVDLHGGEAVKEVF